MRTPIVTSDHEVDDKAMKTCEEVEDQKILKAQAEAQTP